MMAVADGAIEEGVDTMIGGGGGNVTSEEGATACGRGDDREDEETATVTGLVDEDAGIARARSVGGGTSPARGGCE